MKEKNDGKGIINVLKLLSHFELPGLYFTVVQIKADGYHDEHACM